MSSWKMLYYDWICFVMYLTSIWCKDISPKRMETSCSSTTLVQSYSLKKKLDEPCILKDHLKGSATSRWRFFSSLESYVTEPSEACILHITYFIIQVTHSQKLCFIKVYDIFKKHLFENQSLYLLTNFYEKGILAHDFKSNNCTFYHV